MFSTIDPSDPLAKDVEAVGRLPSVSTILRVVAQTTGMGYSLVARVTDTQWVACAVHDDISFGLPPGGILDVAMTLCSEVRDTKRPVVIDHVATDAQYCEHRVPKHYGFQSYIAVPIFLKDGSYFGNICALDPKPAQVKQPRVLGMMTLFSDLVAAQLDIESQLQDANLDVKLREEFIAVLTHDLRNPLNSISIGVDDLAKSVSDERQQRIVKRLGNSAQRMAKMIDDLLDFTRVRMGSGLGLKLTDGQNLAEKLKHVVAELESAHPRSSVRLKLECSGAFSCDVERIAQMTSNLIANALQHGAPAKPVVVEVQESASELIISVENEGAPIPPERLPLLFRPYTRGGEGSPTGLGLGLYIASEIARAHHGNLSVTSTPERTRFVAAMLR